MEGMHRGGRPREGPGAPREHRIRVSSGEDSGDSGGSAPSPSPSTLSASASARASTSSPSSAASPAASPSASGWARRKAKAQSRRRSSWAGRQAAVGKLMEGLSGGDGPACYSYPVFLNYLAQAKQGPATGDFNLREALSRVLVTRWTSNYASLAEGLGLVARKLLATAGGSPVYLADGGAYIEEGLREEFPELALFRISLGEAFAESGAHPGLFTETKRFADLRSLSRMRRELRRTGFTTDLVAVEVIQALLGLA